MSEQVVLTGHLERVKKYTKKWAKRYCTFDPKSRKFTYSEDEGEKAPPKAFLLVSKVTRCAEVGEIKAGPDLYTMQIDGLVDGVEAKHDSWQMRFPSEDVFDTWYESMRRSLALAGLMDPYNYGLPAIDPRQRLPFAKIPLSHLFKFGLLEKAIVYNFSVVRYFDPTGGTCPEAVLVIGDKLIYMFRLNADVLRCSQITNVKELRYSKGVEILGISMNPPEADYCLQCSPTSVESIRQVLSVQFKATQQGKALPCTPLSEVKLENLGANMRAKPDEGYKIEVASPTPKSRLKHALDAYEKQHGKKFDPETIVKAKKDGVEGAARANSVGVPSENASPKGGASSDLDLAIPLVRFLCRIGMQQYAPQLLKQHVDLDVLQCMDLTDLETFGVKSAADRQTILSAANNQELLTAVNTNQANDSFTNTSMASQSSSSTATLPATVSAPAPAPVAAATPSKAVINLDSDDDLDVVVASSASPTTKPVIVLDDSDDDLDLLPVSKPNVASPTKAPIVLPDDDDDI